VHELKRQGHSVFLFTLEDHPEGIENIKFYTIKHTFIAAYPGKKVGEPTLASLRTIYSVLRDEKPDLIHTTADRWVCNLWNQNNT
jgi:hypothetical protein